MASRTRWLGELKQNIKQSNTNNVTHDPLRKQQFNSDEHSESVDAETQKKENVDILNMIPSEEALITLSDSLQSEKGSSKKSETVLQEINTYVNVPEDTIDSRINGPPTDSNIHASVQEFIENTKESKQQKNNIDNIEIGKKAERKRDEWKVVETEKTIKLFRIQKHKNDSESSFSEDDDDSLKDPDFSGSSVSSSSSSQKDSDTNEMTLINSTVLEPGTSTEIIGKGKKRVKNSANWLKNEAKRLRNSGQDYINYKTKKKFKKREMKSPCRDDRCRLKCSSKIGYDERITIFQKYWQLGDITRQRDFISKCMYVVKPKYRYTNTQQGRRFNNTFYIEVGNESIKVCKTFFKNTLGINDRPIRTVINKKESGFVIEDFRGKHKNHHRVDEEIKNGVRNHIRSIPKIESHYLRQQTSREYIEGGRTLTDLYSDYKNECITKKAPYANLAMYCNIFNSEFNISFFIPKKDQCGLCSTYSNTEGEEKKDLEEQYIKHQEEKKLSRIEKNYDKQKVGPTFKVACYDLQAVFQCPKGDLATFYYKSKLNVHNFTICELNSDKVECFVWHEGLANRGANAIATCVYKYLEDVANSVNSNDLEVVLYSDNCCGQQKNRYMMLMYMYAVRHLKIKTISHKFLIKGHTQNEGDSVHSVVEKSVKKALKSGPIYVPSQFVTIIQNAKKKGNPYHVTEMSFNDFFNIKSLSEQCGNIFNCRNDNDFKISELKIFKVTKEDPYTVFYKKSFSEAVYREHSFRKRRLAQTFDFSNYKLPLAYLSPIPLNEKKKADLMSLIKSKHIKPFYADFYNSVCNV